MTKYEPLAAFLKDCPTEEIPMTFADIERVIGAPLPNSKRYPAWWSNNPSNNVMTQVWLDAGFQTERVDTTNGRLVFRRVAAKGETTARKGGNLRQRLAALGPVWIAEGVDITAPTGEVWDAEVQ